MDYRFKHTLSVFKPDAPFDTDRGDGGCCCNLNVFADLTSSNEWKNDTTLAYFKKATSSDTCTFQLTKCGSVGVLTNYGTVATFPNDTLAVGYMYDWNDILLNHGAGKYTITLSYTKAGVPGTKTWGVYQLAKWSQDRVNNLVRLRSLFRSYHQKENIDFSGSNCFDTIRVSGIFGKRDPKTEVNQLINKGFVSQKTTRRNDNTYLLETDPIEYCVSKYLLDLHTIGEDECYVTEHNRKNHFYGYIDYPVHVEESPQVEYPTKSRKLSVKITFADRVKNDKTMYNGL